MLSTPVGRLRVVGFVEGVSFLLLLGVAMPLKYAAGMPEVVFWVGLAHGLLFLLYVAAVAHAYSARGLAPRLAGWALVASVLPAGPFVLDARLRAQDRPAPADG